MYFPTNVPHHWTPLDNKQHTKNTSKPHLPAYCNILKKCMRCSKKYKKGNNFALCAIQITDFLGCIKNWWLCTPHYLASIESDRIKKPDRKKCQNFLPHHLLQQLQWSSRCFRLWWELKIILSIYIYLIPCLPSI